MRSALEEKFARLWVKTDPAFERLDEEVSFHPERKWRFDFAHRHSKVAIEIEGGLRTTRKANVRGKSMLVVGGRHNSADGFMEDCEKYAAATFLGWAVIRLAGDHITRETVEHIQRFICHRCGIVNSPSPKGIHRKTKSGRKWTQADVARVVAKVAKRVSR